MRFTGQNKRTINPKYFLNESEAPFRTMEEKRQEYPKYIRAMNIIEEAPASGDITTRNSFLSQAGAVIYAMFLRDIAGDNQVDPIAVAESMVADLKASRLGDKDSEGPIGTAQQMGASLEKEMQYYYRQDFSTLKKNVESHVKHAMTPEYQPQPQPEPEPLTATKPEFAPDVSNRKGVVCRAAYLVQVQAEKALTASGRTDLLPRVQDYKRFKNKTAIMGTVTLAILNKALEESGEKPFAPTDFAGACRDAARVMKVAPKIATIDVASVIEKRGGSAVASAAPQGQPSSALTESKIRDASYNRLKDEKNKKLFEALIKG